MTDLMLLTEVLRLCPDCRDETLMLPVDPGGRELCCTGCDAALSVFDTLDALAAEPVGSLLDRCAG